MVAFVPRIRDKERIQRPPDAEESDRAGTFRLVGRGDAAYRAFIPKPLPPVPKLAMDGALLNLFGRASSAIGRLDGISARLQNPSALLWTYVRKEAVLSSQIEGTQSSLTDLLLHENEQAPGVSTDDVEEVSRYVSAMMTGLERPDGAAGTPGHAREGDDPRGDGQGAESNLPVSPLRRSAR